MQKSVGFGFFPCFFFLCVVFLFVWFLFLGFFSFFLHPTKGLLWPRFKLPCPRRTFSRHSHGTDHVPLFMSDDSAALKFLLLFELSAICLGSEEAVASFALMHSVYSSLH